jgi:hypothetical protein
MWFQHVLSVYLVLGTLYFVLVLCTLYFVLRKLLNTSGFWPRVRARALHAPVFWNSLPRKTGAARPTRLSQLRCFLFDPQK